MAATVIIYTACWYVKISDVKEGVVNGDKEYKVTYYYDDEILYGEIDRILSGYIIDNVKDVSENEYSVTEPVKIKIQECSESDGKYETYRICYYSTELRAQTAYECYKSDYENLTIDGNVIIISY